jgi:hypothetical protein
MKKILFSLLLLSLNALSWAEAIATRYWIASPRPEML